MEESEKEGYCEKRSENSPDCAECKDFSVDDIREELAAQGEGFSSLCFRVFHRDVGTRTLWRHKVCRHYREA